jgi:hypothetical protein
MEGEVLLIEGRLDQKATEGLRIGEKLRGLSFHLKILEMVFFSMACRRKLSLA